MNYELAKKLKDAGFPQRDNKDCNDPVVCCIHQPTPTEGEEQMIIFPTLSELIEACGDKFGVLLRNNIGWITYSSLDRGELDKSIYSTPEEAVANLWLALQK